MKIQLDTENKTIKVEKSVNLGELVEKIQIMLPDWKEYKLETNTVINWTSYPTIIYRDKYPISPLSPYYGINTSYSDTILQTTNLNATNYSTKGILNVEL